MNSKSIKGRIKLVSPIAYFSNVIAVLPFFMFVVVLTMLNIKPTTATMFATFSLCSIALQTYIFKIKGIQESEWVDKKWLKKEHKFTAAQLNRYSGINYKFFTYVKASIILVALFAGDEGASSFAVVVLMGSFIFRQWLGRKGIIPFPAGFLKVTKGGSTQRYTLDTANQLGSGISSYKWKDM